MAIAKDDLEEVKRMLEEGKEDQEYSERTGCCAVHRKRKLTSTGLVISGIEETYACPVKGCKYQVILRASERAQEQYNKDMKIHFTI